MAAETPPGLLARRARFVLLGAGDPALGRAFADLLERDPGRAILNVSHPRVLRMVTESRRPWVEVMGVDGVRFDIATTLGREPHEFDPARGFLEAVQQDPAPRTCKLIAEPRDIGPGGYRLCGFPVDLAEWNDRFRDGVQRFRRRAPTPRRIWRVGCWAAMFDRPGRKPFITVNLVAAHDGLTLADATRCVDMRNDANG